MHFAATAWAMIVLKGLLSALGWRHLCGRARCYVEQGRFHGQNGGYETLSFWSFD